MSTDNNRDLVTNFWQSLGKGDIKVAFASLSDEVSWVIPGDLADFSGLRKGKSEILDMARGQPKVFQAG